MSTNAGPWLVIAGCIAAVAAIAAAVVFLVVPLFRMPEEEPEPTMVAA